jgi:tripartite ATP-independent transporter DctM subunit
MTDISLSTVAFIGIGLFLILMFLRMPIGVAMLLSAFAGIAIIRGLPAALNSMGLALYRTASTYNLSVIPLFIFMGVLAGVGGISRNAFYSLNKWFGHLPGGLAMAATGACSAFGAVCGNHIATAATMCSAALPEMRRYNYDDKLSLGCISAGGNLGYLIPPSGAFIVYGFMTETSIGQLFIAGILPGLLITFMFMAQINVQCRLNPSLGPTTPAASWKERLISVKGIVGIVGVFIIVMGGIYAGFFTPTEAGAVGVVAVFLLSIVGRELTRKGFVNSLLEASKVSAMIMLLIIGAKLFATFLTLTEVPITLTTFIEGLDVNRYVILAAVLVVYIICGFFMDIFAVLMVSLPIVFPIVVLQLGFDPLYFGVLSVVTIMIGSISPPFGVVVFAIHGMTRVPLLTIFRGCIPFIVVMVIGLVILTAFPQVSTVLADMMMPYR